VIERRPKAYSYIRFSTPDQERGDSFRRQSTMAQQYAATHGLDLDEQLTFQDLGVSAYKGRNLEVGRLADFLEAVHVGQVERGSYLLVEALDRLSRMVPRKAVRALESIIDAGIVVVTLNDGRRYTQETIDGDGGLNLLIALVTFMRANEESATKSRRLRAAWEGKRAAIGTKPLTSTVPNWLRLDKSTEAIVEIPERVGIVRRVFGEYLSGMGTATIAACLNRDGVPCFGRGQQWWDSYVSKLLDSDAVCGVLSPHRREHTSSGGVKKVPLDKVFDYYPVVVSRETFDEVQALRQGKRTGRQRPGALVNIFSGLARCPRCYSIMTRVNKGSAIKGGKPKLVCVRAKGGAGCTYHGVQLEVLEQVLVGRAKEIEATMPHPDEDLQGQFDAAQAAVEALDDVVGNLLESLEAGHSEALSKRLREVEVDLVAARGARDHLMDRMAACADLVRERRAAALTEALQASPLDRGKVNSALRRLVDQVVIDYDAGAVRLEWAAGGQTELVFAMPKQPA